MNRKIVLPATLAALVAAGAAAASSGPLLKPYVLASTPTGSMAATVAATESALTAHGFTVVGSYSPYPDATVICATDHELETQAAHTRHGGFGVVERVAVTRVQGKLQVSYANPPYFGAAYGLGALPQTAAALSAGLGNQLRFGSKGLTAHHLKPGHYHYAFMMPYFGDVDVLKRYSDHAAAVEAIDHNLAQGVDGVHKVYRVDSPGTQTTVYGVALTQGQAGDAHIMHIIDVGQYRSTAHLPYELMVQGRTVLALPAQFRIAIDFPDLTMFGDHGFTHIIKAPDAIKKDLRAVAGGHG